MPKCSFKAIYFCSPDSENLLGKIDTDRKFLPVFSFNSSDVKTTENLILFFNS